MDVEATRLVVGEEFGVAALVDVGIEDALFDQELRPAIVAVPRDQGVVQIEQA